MQAETGVAAVALVALIAYAVLAGADFGGGIWDAFARGPRAARQRDAVAHAMGPVWEANHVWLIFVVVLLFTGFPSAYAALSVGLFVPFHLVLLGIILRGAAFVFRAYSPQSARTVGPGRGGRRWGAVFGVASTVTPVLLGMCLGAVSSGRLRVIDGVVSADGPAPWLAPVSLAMGAFALAVCAYLAAVYLANETEGELRDDFRRRALWAGTATVALSVLVLPLLHAQAPHLWRGLLSARAAPVVGAGGVAALLSGWALLRHRFRLARAATVIQTACLLGGWGIAQYPYLIYPDVTVHAAAAPAPTLRFVLWSLPFGLALLLPSLSYLFRVFKGGHLSVLDPPSAEAPRTEPVVDGG
ncbi:MAG: cytochrome bd ubiquinol oxidase subunit [Gemmatimonadetes bacterium]|nr:cytochrome bd ubiquinol oxidase subunit [Gemmatimonadota bacterium]